MLLPHPLNLRLIEPTLLEWTIVEPECSEPHQWLGGYEHLRQALELDPDNQLARGKLISCILSQVGFNGHELPNGYLGIAKGDLEVLGEAEELVPALHDIQFRDFIAAQIKLDRSRIEDYLRRMQH